MEFLARAHHFSNTTPFSGKQHEFIIGNLRGSPQGHVYPPREIAGPKMPALLRETPMGFHSPLMPAISWGNVTWQLGRLYMYKYPDYVNIHISYTSQSDTFHTGPSGSHEFKPR